MKKRYTHQILICERCFTSFYYDEIDNKKLKNYLKHEMFILFGIGVIYARINNSDEADANLNKMWQTCIAHDKNRGRHFRYRTPLWWVCIPGGFGRKCARVIYRIANKIVRFN